MKLLNNSRSKNQFIGIIGPKYLDNLRYVGKIVAKALSTLENFVANKTTNSLLELDLTIEKFFLENNCRPVFKGYHGFPATVCMSLNNELVHGIPKDYILQGGDVISFDTGAEYKGATADSAFSCVYGEPRDNKHVELLCATQRALYAGIKAARPGSRVGAIGHAINRTSKQLGFRVIEQYGGHGISQKMEQGEVKGVVHSEPFIANKSEANEGIRIQEGMVLAIEPLLVPQNISNNTTLSSDNWTVLTEDIGAHYEHSIYVSNDGAEILTKRDNENII